MTVKSVNMKDGQAVERGHRPPWVPLAALIIGLILWPIGARFTIDGVIWIGNWILAFLRMPGRLPDPTWATYIVLAPLPFIASFVEWRPMRWNWSQEVRNPYGIVVWAVIVGLDAISTYIGIRTPDTNSAALMREVGASLAFSGILATVLTFGPEWLIREGWRQLWR